MMVERDGLLMVVGVDPEDVFVYRCVDSFLGIERVYLGKFFQMLLIIGFNFKGLDGPHAN